MFVFVCRSFTIKVTLEPNSKKKEMYEFSVKKLPNAISTDSKKSYWKVSDMCHAWGRECSLFRNTHISTSYAKALHCIRCSLTFDNSTIVLFNTFDETDYWFWLVCWSFYYHCYIGKMFQGNLLNFRTSSVHIKTQLYLNIRMNHVHSIRICIDMHKEYDFCFSF